jgi:inner membrane protein involved in colicin E2 resistance
MISADVEIAAIMAMGDFTQDVVVAGQTVKGDFTDATESVNPIDGRVEANAPTLICSTADVENVARKAAVTVNGTAYTVERNERLGTGQNVLYLKT